MSPIFKFIYELATDPLGLPIDAWKEYFILFIIDRIAYEIAYAKVGDMYHLGLITTRTGGSCSHWTIRLPFFVAMWAITYGAIWLYRFVAAHWVTILSVAIIILFTALAVFAIIKTINHFKNTGDKNNA